MRDEGHSGIRVNRGGVAAPTVAADSIWSAASPAKHDDRATARVVQVFVLFQIACQLALLLPEVGAIRIAVRVSAVGVSLLLLAFLRGRPVRHPSLPAAWVVLAILALSFFHPT